MTAVTIIIDLVLIIVSIILIITVLMQQGQRQGLGAIGMTMIAKARMLGAGKIIALDSVPMKLKLAKEFGAVSQPEPFPLRNGGTPAPSWIRAIMPTTRRRTSIP